MASDGVKSSAIPSITTSLVAADVSASIVRTNCSLRLSGSVPLLARLPAFFIGSQNGPRLATTRMRGVPPPLMAAAICVFRLLMGPA